MWRKYELICNHLSDGIKMLCNDSLKFPYFVNCKVNSSFPQDLKKSEKLKSKPSENLLSMETVFQCCCLLFCMSFQRLQNTFQEPNTSVLHPLQSPVMSSKSFVEGSYFKKSCLKDFSFFCSICLLRGGRMEKLRCIVDYK